MSRIFLIICIVIFNSQLVFAASKKNQNDPIVTTKIKSNFIKINRQNESIYFYEDVIVEREDISILADKIIVHYYEDKNKEQKKSKKKSKKLDNKASIKEIEAQDNVKIFNADFTATGEYGIYKPKQNSIILKENVIFNKGTSVAKGEKFIYNIETKKGKLFASRTDGRVTVIINDNEMTEQKTEQDNE